nr:zinc finger protein 40-like isoform X2 [Petromyzon marinus]XP_032810748.1 zinc finger protein 40-like isoform X2 [Petromyzon marinus]
MSAPFGTGERAYVTHVPSPAAPAALHRGLPAVVCPAQRPHVEHLATRQHRQYQRQYQQQQQQQQQDVGRAVLSLSPGKMGECLTVAYAASALVSRPACFPNGQGGRANVGGLRAGEEAACEAPGAAKERPKRLGRYVCGTCGMGCAKPSVLEKHVRSHTGERPYPCSICNSAFKTKSNLSKHMKSQAHVQREGGSCGASAEQQQQQQQQGEGSGRDDGDDAASDCDGDDDSDTDDSPEAAVACGRVVLGWVPTQSAASEPGAFVHGAHAEAEPARDDRRCNGGDGRQACADERAEAAVRTRDPSVERSQEVERHKFEMRHLKISFESESGSPMGKNRNDSGYRSFSESLELPSVTPTTAHHFSFTEGGGRSGEAGPVNSRPPVFAVAPAAAATMRMVLPSAERVAIDKHIGDHIDKLISQNEALVDNRELDSVKPRRASCARRASIDSPRPYTFKDSFQFDLRPQDPHGRAGPELMRSPPPFSPHGKSGVRPWMPLFPPPKEHGAHRTDGRASAPRLSKFASSGSLGHSLESQCDDVFTPGPGQSPPPQSPRLTRQEAVDEGAARLKTQSVDEASRKQPVAAEGDGDRFPKSRSLDEVAGERRPEGGRRGRRAARGRGLMFECDTCGVKYRKPENYEAHKKYYCSELHAPRTRSLGPQPAGNTHPQLGHYKVSVDSLEKAPLMKKRKRAHGSGDRDEEEAAVPGGRLTPPAALGARVLTTFVGQPEADLGKSVTLLDKLGANGGSAFVFPCVRFEGSDAKAGGSEQALSSGAFAKTVPLLCVPPRVGNGALSDLGRLGDSLATFGRAKSFDVPPMARANSFDVTRADSVGQRRIGGQISVIQHTKFLNKAKSVDSCEPPAECSATLLRSAPWKACDVASGRASSDEVLQEASPCAVRFQNRAMVTPQPPPTLAGIAIKIPKILISTDSQKNEFEQQQQQQHVDAPVSDCLQVSVEKLHPKKQQMRRVILGLNFDDASNGEPSSRRGPWGSNPADGVHPSVGLVQPLEQQRRGSMRRTSSEQAAGSPPFVEVAEMLRSRSLDLGDEEPGAAPASAMRPPPRSTKLHSTLRPSPLVTASTPTSAVERGEEPNRDQLFIPHYQIQPGRIAERASSPLINKPQHRSDVLESVRDFGSCDASVRDRCLAIKGREPEDSCAVPKSYLPPQSVAIPVSCSEELPCGSTSSPPQGTLQLSPQVSILSAPAALPQVHPPLSPSSFHGDRETSSPSSNRESQSKTLTPHPTQAPIAAAPSPEGRASSAAAEHSARKPSPAPESDELNAVTAPGNPAASQVLVVLPRGAAPVCSAPLPGDAGPSSSRAPAPAAPVAHPDPCQPRGAGFDACACAGPPNAGVLVAPPSGRHKAGSRPASPAAAPSTAAASLAGNPSAEAPCRKRPLAAADEAGEELAAERQRGKCAKQAAFGVDGARTNAAAGKPRKPFLQRQERVEEPSVSASKPEGSAEHASETPGSSGRDSSATVAAGEVDAADPRPCAAPSGGGGPPPPGTYGTAADVSWCYLQAQPSHHAQGDGRASVYSRWDVGDGEKAAGGGAGGAGGVGCRPPPPPASSGPGCGAYTTAVAVPQEYGRVVQSCEWKSSRQICQVKDEGKAAVPQQAPAHQGKAPSLDEATGEGADGAVPETRRVKIFEGGYKSNEEYVYVRGRGRGKYVCEECGIRCRKPSMLRKHIRSHSDLRPYRCNVCRFSFKTKGNLTKHVKSKTHSKKCVDTGVTPCTSLDEADDDCDASGYAEGEKGGDDSEDDNDSDDEDEEEEGSIDSTEILPVASASQGSAAERHPSDKPPRSTGSRSPSECPAAKSPNGTEDAHRERGAGRPEAMATASSPRSPSLFSHLPLHSQLQAERTLLPMLQVGSGGAGCGAGSLQLLAPTSAALLPTVPECTLAGGGGFVGFVSSSGITSLRCLPVMSLPLATKISTVKALPLIPGQIPDLLVPAEASGASGRAAVDSQGQDAARECRISHNGHSVAVTLTRANEPTGV